MSDTPKQIESQPQVGSDALVLAVNGRRVIFRNVETYTEERFEARYKGHSITIERQGPDKDHHDYYITVTHPSGGYVYDGFWKIPWEDCSDPTMKKAIIESLRGSLLISGQNVQGDGSPDEKSQPTL